MPRQTHSASCSQPSSPSHPPLPVVLDHLILETADIARLEESASHTRRAIACVVIPAQPHATSRLQLSFASSNWMTTNKFSGDVTIAGPVLWRSAAEGQQ